MASWQEKAADYVTLLIAAAQFTATVTTTDIRAKADLVKNSSADTSSLQASEIARKIRDDIKKERPDITISGSL